MKKIFLTTCAIIISHLVHAQKDTIVIYPDELKKPCQQNEASFYTIQYKEQQHWKKSLVDARTQQFQWTGYFKDKACEIHDGEFIQFYTDGKTLTKGRYSDNKKTGVWKSWSKDKMLTDSVNYKDGFIYGIGLSWHPNSSIIDSLIFEEGGNGIEKSFWPNGENRQTGPYVAGKKDGQWTYFYKSGIKCQEVIYKSDSAISFICYDQQGKVQVKDCIYEREAMFKGGDNAWRRYLGQRLNSAPLPKAYRQGRISGIAYIQFIVDTLGSITDIQVIKSAHPELDKIAVAIIRDSPEWIPAVQYNRKVKAYRKQPITFLPLGE